MNKIIPAHSIQEISSQQAVLAKNDKSDKAGNKIILPSLSTAKLYIIDDEIAYLGSINFTTSGHQFNHETRIRTTDSEAIRQLKEEFNELLHNDFYNAKTIHEWGVELYEGES